MWLSMCANGSVRYANNRGKMYSRHLFPYAEFVRNPHRAGVASVDKKQKKVYKVYIYTETV